MNLADVGMATRRRKTVNGNVKRTCRRRYKHAPILLRCIAPRSKHICKQTDECDVFPFCQRTKWAIAVQRQEGGSPWGMKYLLFAFRRKIGRFLT